MSPSSQGTYRNNALNQRSHKLAAGRETRFVHGPGGELLFERSSPASTYSDKAYVWFDGQVVALVSNNTVYSVYSVYSDHLGRPVQVRTTGNATVWGASLQAFDRTATTDQIGGFHIGYPGQYFDAESGLWNNWHRYYDGSVGRYTQSDPIGLAGGINTYGYVGGNPISRTDRRGLEFIDEGTGSGIYNSYQPGSRRCSCTAGGFSVAPSTPNAGNVVAGSMAGGAGAGAIAGGVLGTAAGVREGAKLGIIAGLAAADAAGCGAIAGATLGGAVGALAGAAIVGGVALLSSSGSNCTCGR